MMVYQGEVEFKVLRFMNHLVMTKVGIHKNQQALRLSILIAQNLQMVATHCSFYQILVVIYFINQFCLLIGIVFLLAF